MHKKNIPYNDHTDSIQPENHLNESKLHFDRYETIVFTLYQRILIN